MNRPIKFRVWDKARNHWLQDSESSFHCFSDYFIDFNGRIVCFSGEIQNPIKLQREHDLSYLSFNPGPIVTNQEDRFIIQQFIGLKDKNDKEIYEGDIVKFRYEMYEHDWTDDLGEVFFENGMFIFGRKTEFTTSDCNFDEQSIEIIGNIFENPELRK